MKGPSNPTPQIIEAKKEEKKSFGSMHMKLVKPPEKKPTDEKPKEILKGMNIKPQPKAPEKTQTKTDIMDFDFGAATQPTAQPAQSQDPLDLLGGGAVSSANPVPVQNPSPMTAGMTSDMLFATSSPASVSVAVPPVATQPPSATNSLNWNLGYSQQPTQAPTVPATTQITLGSSNAPPVQPPVGVIVCLVRRTRPTA